MWDKLLGLFKDTYGDEDNYVPASIVKREARRQELASQPTLQSQESYKEPGNGTLIGFNYLKGMDDEDANRTRKFINLAKLLRGDYKDGKIETTSTEPESDIRRKNTQ